MRKGDLSDMFCIFSEFGMLQGNGVSSSCFLKEVAPCEELESVKTTLLNAHTR